MKINRRLSKGFRRAYKTCPTVHEIILGAKAGELKKDWYHKAANSIYRSYGTDSNFFCDILAATSPQQAVKNNLIMAEAVYKAHKKGASLVNILRLVDLKCRKGNVKRALFRSQLRGPKVTAFSENLKGNLWAVTIDTWMIAFAGVKNSRCFEKGSAHMLYERRICKAAKILDWKPAEVQASVWAYTYAKVNQIELNDVPEFQI